MALLALLRAAPLAGQPHDASASAPDTLRLELGAAARMAAERSPRVALSRLGAREAEATVRQERAALLPHLSVEGSHGARTFNVASFGLELPAAPGEDPPFDPAGEVLGPVETVDVRGHLSQTLFDWSALQQLRSARASRSAAEVAREVARQEAAAEAAAAWVRAERARGRLAARREDLELAEALLSDARELLAAGVGIRLDVTRAEARLATLRAELVAARSEERTSLLALKRALDLPPDRPVALVETDPEPSADPLEDDADEAVSVALARRPELVELDRRMDAARLSLSAADAERLPTLRLQAGDGFNGAGYDRLLNTYEWSLQLSVPVFQGQASGARRDLRRARLSALEVRRADLENQVAFHVEDALLRLRSARELVVASRSRLELARQEVDEARERFDAGVAGSSDLFTATLRLNEARTAAADALAGWHGARVSLAAAEGLITELR